MNSYEINGQRYHPTTVNVGQKFRGIASWYGPKFHGKKTSNGETYNMYAMTAAHKTLPMNTVLKVTHLNNKKSIKIRINDRGPFVDDRIIDLSKKAAKHLNILEKGTAYVEIEVLGFYEKNKKSYSKRKNFTSNTFYVQIASFTSKERAYSFKKLHSNSYGKYKTIVKYKGIYHKVLIKGFKSEEEARSFIQTSNIKSAFVIGE